MTFTIAENPHRHIKHSVRPPVDSYRILAPQDPNRARKPFGAARKAPPRRAKPAAAPAAPGVNDENAVVGRRLAKQAVPAADATVEPAIASGAVEQRPAPAAAARDAREEQQPS